MNKALISATADDTTLGTDKSYYYWHKYVTNSVAVDPPTLLEKRVVHLPEDDVWNAISNYSWMDDDATVK